MECHNCEFAGALARGEFRGQRFDKTPCARCDGQVAEHFARVPVDEAMPAPGLSVPEQVCAAEEDDSESVMMPLSVLVAAMASFLSLRPGTMRLLQLRHAGMSCEQVARRLGMSVDAVQMRLHRAVQKRPEFASFFRWNTGENGAKGAVQAE